MIVVLTALDLEYAAVRRRLDGLTTRWVAGTAFEVGVTRRAPGHQVALAAVGEPGNTVAATITQSAITEFAPTAVVFAGVAGALRSDIALGDLVVATRVHAYHGARQDEGKYGARPRSWESSRHLVETARHLVRTGRWAGAKVHFQTIAAGEVVLNSTRSPLGRQLDRHYDDAVAIEMESAGVAQAAHLNDATPTITVRGISDHADGGKDAGGAQERAADAAAEFAVLLVDALGDTGPAAPPARRAQGSTVTNSADGDSWVGVQAGHVTGNIIFGSDTLSDTRKGDRR